MHSKISASFDVSTAGASAVQAKSHSKSHHVKDSRDNEDSFKSTFNHTSNADNNGTANKPDKNNNDKPVNTPPSENAINEVGDVKRFEDDFNNANQVKNTLQGYWGVSKGVDIENVSGGITQENGLGESETAKTLESYDLLNGVAGVEGISNAEALDGLASSYVGPYPDKVPVPASPKAFHLMQVTAEGDAAAAGMSQAGLSVNTLSGNNVSSLGAGFLGDRNQRFNVLSANIYSGDQGQSFITDNLPAQLVPTERTANSHQLLTMKEGDLTLNHQKITEQLNTMLGKNTQSMTPINSEVNNISAAAITEADDRAAALMTYSSANEQKNLGLHAEKVIVMASVKVGQPGWADQIAERTASLVSQNIKQAEIQLNPQEMGAINIKISVSQDQQVAVTFTAQNAGVRDALDQSMQRLRDTLDSEGLNLVQADVGGQSAQSGDEPEEESALISDVNDDASEDNQDLTALQVTPSGIDHFA